MSSEASGFDRCRQTVLSCEHARLIRVTAAGDIVREHGSVLTAPQPIPKEAVVIGRWQNDPVAVLPIAAHEAAISGRACFLDATSEQLPMLAAALQIAHWRTHHRFCGRCGAPTVQHPTEYAMQCPHCHTSSYPPQSPCIITLITHGDAMLLAHNAHFPSGRYSTLAGFIEPGESAEDALHREVMEEVGITVSSLRFFKSQSWPFPHSFMLGFFAEADSMALQVDGVEITHAGWFTADNLPDLPPKGAISRALIDTHLARLRQPQ